MIWATGYEPDHAWVNLPVFGAKGGIRHAGGVAGNGLYVIGLRYLRNARSSHISGAGLDAEVLADHLAADDGHGNTEGTATGVTNGVIHHFTFQGTYVVLPDCTGSMTLLVAPIGATVPLDFVIDDDGAEVRAITTGNITGNTETREYRKQFSKGKDK